MNNESNWTWISLAEEKTEDEKPLKQAGTEDGCNRPGRASQGRFLGTGDVYGPQTSGSQIPKYDNFIQDHINLFNYFWSHKMREMCI